MCWCSCAYDSTHTQWLYSVRPTAAARTVRSQHSNTSRVQYLQGVCIECRVCAARAACAVAVAIKEYCSTALSEAETVLKEEEEEEKEEEEEEEEALGPLEHTIPQLRK